MFMENPTCTKTGDVSENKTDQKEEEKISCTNRAWVLIRERQAVKKISVCPLCTRWGKSKFIVIHMDNDTTINK